MKTIKDEDGFLESEHTTLKIVLASIFLFIMLVALAGCIYLLKLSKENAYGETSEVAGVSQTESIQQTEEISNAEENIQTEETKQTEDDMQTVSTTPVENTTEIYTSDTVTQETTLAVSEEMPVTDATQESTVQPENISETTVSSQASTENNGGIKTQFEACNDIVTAKIEVNLRTLPSVTNVDSQVIAVLHNGETVTRTGKNDELGWSRVDYNGQTLYCVSSYLTFPQ